MKRKAKKLLKLCLVCLAATTLMPGAAGATTFAQITASTFGIGGPGAALIQLLLISIVAWLAMYISNAVGNGQIAGMIRVTATFTCIGIIAGLAWQVIKAVCAFAGIQI